MAPRSGLAVAVAPQGKRAFVFGGVRDIEETEEEITGELSNELQSLDLESARWHDVTLRRAGPRGEAGGGDAAAVHQSEEDTTPVTIITDEVFTIKLGGPSTAPMTPAAEARAVREENPGPSARMNAMMTIQKSVLYVYGGILEKGTKQFTLSDMYSLDTHKLSEWKVLLTQSSLPEWCGSDSEQSYETDSCSEEEDSDSE